MKRTIKGIALLLLSALMLFSCGGRERGCEEMFSELYGKERLAAGRLYLLKANEWEDGYLSSELFSSLYVTPPNEDANEEMSLLEDCAIYLSSSLDAVCEVGIFLCHSNTDTERIAKMCHRRISLIYSLKDYTDLPSYENVRVEIKGRYVIYALFCS